MKSQPIIILIIILSLALLGIVAWNSLEQIDQRHAIAARQEAHARERADAEREELRAAIAADRAHEKQRAELEAVNAERQRRADAVLALRAAVLQRDMDDLNGGPPYFTPSRIASLIEAATALNPEHTSTLRKAHPLELAELASSIVQNRAYHSPLLIE